MVSVMVVMGDGECDGRGVVSVVSFNRFTPTGL